MSTTQTNAIELADQYRRQGYLTELPVLDPNALAAYCGAFAELEENLGTQATHMKIVDAHFDHRFIWQLATHSKALDWVQYAMGTDIVLLGSHFFCKYPGMGDQIVTWHQDSLYWGLQPPHACTIWLAMDDVDADNGCMRVIPSSHELGEVSHGNDWQEGNLLAEGNAVAEKYVHESAAVDICLAAGFASLHDALLIHGSHPNHSSRRRCGLTLRYTSPETRIVARAGRAKGITPEKSPQGWSPILVRGEDRFGHLPLVPAPFGP